MKIGAITILTFIILLFASLFLPSCNRYTSEYECRNRIQAIIDIAESSEESDRKYYRRMQCLAALEVYKHTLPIPLDKMTKLDKAIYTKFWFMWIEECTYSDYYEFYNRLSKMHKIIKERYNDAK